MLYETIEPDQICTTRTYQTPKSGMYKYLTLSYTNILRPNYDAAKWLVTLCTPTEYASVKTIH